MTFYSAVRISGSVILVLALTCCHDTASLARWGSMLPLTADDHIPPSEPQTDSYFVLDAHKDKLFVKRGPKHDRRPTLQLEAVLPSSLHLPDVEPTGNAVLVFRFGWRSFPEKYSFYVENVSGLDHLNLEIKTSDKQVRWYFLRNLPKGIWQKATMSIGSLHEEPLAWDIDPNNINEVLVHFKEGGTVRLDGFGKIYQYPQVELKEILEVKTSAEPSDSLRAAVESNDQKTVLSLLRRGKAINAHQGSEDTPLMRAIRKKNIPMAQLLFTHGAAVNLRAGNGSDVYIMSPLPIAIANNDMNAFRFLLDHGADANSRCQGSLDPLHLAVIQQNFEMVSMLLRSGANVNFASRSNETALMRAVKLGDTRIAVLLLDSGADPNKAEYDLGNAHYGIESVTPLVEAVREGDAEMVKLLVDHGANLSQEANLQGPYFNFHHTTALQLSIEMQFTEIEDLLRKKGVQK